MLALVLSGGGLFGRVAGGSLECVDGPDHPGHDRGRFRRGAQWLCDRERRQPRRAPQHVAGSAFAHFADLPHNIRRMMARYTLRMPFAITAVELPRMKPRIFRDSEITWRHLAASCALPLASAASPHRGALVFGRRTAGRPARMGGRGARSTQIIGLQALPQPPSWWLGQATRAFRAVVVHNPPVPPGIDVCEIRPGRSLGSVRDTIQWSA